jgi:hypothetical protein
LLDSRADTNAQNDRRVWKFAALIPIFYWEPSPNYSGPLFVDIHTETVFNTVMFAYYPIPPPATPTIGSVTPNSGLWTGGTAVTITATGF